jgi:hypothetical protein
LVDVGEGRGALVAGRLTSTAIDLCVMECVSS